MTACYNEGMRDRGELLELARQARQRMTKAEVFLWARLRANRLCGYKFRRQAVVGEYIVDFLCFAEKLIVEADGGGHSEDASSAYQKRRTAYLQAQGYRILRFWNTDIIQNTDLVLEEILRVLEEGKK